MSDNGHHCSFCGKHQDYVEQLIAGPASMICDECIAMCVEIIAEHKRNKIRAAHGIKEE